MTRRMPPQEDALPPFDVDLSQIFIGREQQLELFRYYLENWQRRVATSNASPMQNTPSPNDRLQGLVVLLHGRGGFGKTTLLKRYRELALDYGQELAVSALIDWEFTAQGSRGIFNLAPGEAVDASHYFTLLCEQIASALGKRLDDFKEYQSAIKDVDEAQKQARGLLRGLERDDRYAWLRGLAGEGILALIRLVPRSEVVLGQEQVAEKIKSVVGEGVQLGIEQVRQVWTRLHESLGPRLDDYLDHALRLGQSLGRDLAQMAKKHPVLIFFDTYEEIDEGDELLRFVMGTAGERVGWVLAGRDNLWAGLSQRLRSQETVYGYKDIVTINRGFSIDFSADGVGDFSLSDIQDYFEQMRKLSRLRPLPSLSEKDAAHLLEITRGVPLAVNIAASLYLEKPDLSALLEEADSKREIVDQMVRRYLLHTRTNQADRTRLYSLALLRRAEEPAAIMVALDIVAPEDYEAELSRLHRRYGFIFTRQGQPALHQEVRYFLRLWLLEHRNEPGIRTASQRLLEAHQAALEALEKQRRYPMLQARLEDEQWVNWYLDVTEQQCWVDPARGVAVLLPFMVAAAIYRREANREASKIGKFFEPVMSQPYRRQWEWTAQSLIYTTSHNPLADELSGLKELVRFASQGTLAFPPPFPSASRELEAALWCRMGEAYKGRNELEATEWYERALSQLSQETGLSEDAFKTLLEVEVQERKQPEDAPPPPRQQPSMPAPALAARNDASQNEFAMAAPPLPVSPPPVQQPTGRKRASLRRALLVGAALVVLLAGAIGASIRFLPSQKTQAAINPTHTPTHISSPTPTSTPTLCGLDAAHPINISPFTVSDPNGLRAETPDGIARFDDQIRAIFQPYIGKTAGLVEVFGGGNLSEAGAALAQNAIDAMKLLADQRFIFDRQRTTFQNFWEGDIGNDQLSMSIIFYQVSLNGSCA